MKLIDELDEIDLIVHFDDHSSLMMFESIFDRKRSSNQKPNAKSKNDYVSMRPMIVTIECWSICSNLIRLCNRVRSSNIY